MNKIEVIRLGKELEWFHLSKGDDCETAYAEVGNAQVPEVQDWSITDIDNIISIRCN